MFVARQEACRKIKSAPSSYHRALADFSAAVYYTRVSNGYNYASIWYKKRQIIKNIEKLRNWFLNKNKQFNNKITRFS